jgi:hypothetical protein
MTDTQDRLGVVADALVELTFGEMQELATSLRDMTGDSDFDPTDPNSWADVLHSWARTYDPGEPS